MADKIRITIISIEADIDQLADVLATVFGQTATAELLKPEPTPASRPENFPPHLRPVPRRRP